MSVKNRVVKTLVIVTAAMFVLTGCTSFGARPPIVTGTEAMAMTDKTPAEVLLMVLNYSQSVATDNGSTQTWTDPAYGKDLTGIWATEPHGTQTLSGWVGKTKASLYPRSGLFDYTQGLLSPESESLATVTRDGDLFTVADPEHPGWLQTFKVSEGLIREETSNGSGTGRKIHIDYFITDQARALFTVATPVPIHTLPPEFVEEGRAK